MSIVLDEMQDVESSFVDEVILPDKDIDSDLQISFSTQSDAINHCEEAADFSEPLAKRARLDRTEKILSKREALIVRELVTRIGKAVCSRLDAIEDRVETISYSSTYLQDKLELFVQTSLRSRSPSSDSQHAFLDTNSDSQSADATKPENGIEDVDGFNFIMLNREEDHVLGSWLGDENKQGMRVRVSISPQDLLHINSNCQTPMKMALTLLDYLFDRDTLASSNLSGHSKHGKKQLDPLLIYGIRCHLIHRFAIAEEDWKHIKQNMDSKCRTAFRRKMLGMPLTVKAFRGKLPSSITSNGETLNGECAASDESLQNADTDVATAEGTDDSNIPQVMMMDTSGQRFQLVQATPEQLSQLNIRIIRNGQIMELSESDAADFELFSPENSDEIFCLVKSEEDEERAECGNT